MNRMNVTQCSRCGKAHEEVELTPSPYDANTSAFLCPTTGEIVFHVQSTEFKAAQSAGFRFGR